MPKIIPLYRPDQLILPVQQVVPEIPHRGCQECSLHKKAQLVCMGPRAERGKDGSVDKPLLVIGEYPNIQDVKAGRPFESSSGYFIRQLVRRYWDGPIIWDYGVRCPPMGTKVSDKQVTACRPYTANTLEEIDPARVLLLGSYAYRAFLGRAPQPVAVRKGYTWLCNDPEAVYDGLEPAVPIYMLLPPLICNQNRFYKEWLIDDIEFALKASVPKQPPWNEVTRVIEDVDDCEVALAEAEAAGWVCWDVETSGEMFNPDFRLLSIAIAFKGSTKSWVWGRDALADPEMRQYIIDILVDPDIELIGQNAKYDCKACKVGLGVMPTPVKHDTRLYNRLIKTIAASDLDTMGELVGCGGHKSEAKHYLDESVKQLRKNKNAANKKGRDQGYNRLTDYEKAAIRLGEAPLTYAFAMMPEDILNRYNARDTVITSLVGEQLEEHLLLEAPPSLGRIWDEVIQKATEAFTQIEAWGMPFSEQAADTFVHYLENEIEQSEARLKKYGDINYGSAVQVRELLYGKLGLSPSKLTNSGLPSTDASTLESLRHHHPVVHDLLEHRRFTKLLGTYAKGMLKQVRADGRIHTTYNLDGARSGRLSSDKPNLQNLPRAESAEGKMARDMFVAGPGNVLVQLDYSQLELRIAADLSGDPKMIQIFRDGDDYHTRTAQLVSKKAWGIAPDAIEKKHRSAAKIINFRTLYGGGDKANAKEIGCTRQEAKTIREAIFGEFTHLAAWIEACRKWGKRHGEAWTYWNGQKARRRDLSDIASPVEGIQITAEHSTWNTPVQGTASEYCLASNIALVDWILEDSFPAMLVGTVHDSIMFEVGKDDVNDLVDHARGVMESWPTRNGVPLVVDAEVGKAWGSLVNHKPGWENQVAA